MPEKTLDHAIAQAILAIDTVWGGDVMNPSGTGRFIADSWFSDVPLPEAYDCPEAAAVRTSGGLSADEVNREAMEAYLAVVDVPGEIARVKEHGLPSGDLRGAFLDGLAECMEVMWDLASEALGQGDEVPYARSVRAWVARGASQKDAGRRTAGSDPGNEPLP